MCTAVSRLSAEKGRELLELFVGQETIERDQIPDTVEKEKS